MPEEIYNDWVKLNVKMAPTFSGVYAFVQDNIILYIGSTWCLRNRCSNNKTKRQIKIELGTISVMYIITNDYIKKEKELILFYRPIYNKQYLLKPKRSKTKCLIEF